MAAVWKSRVEDMRFIINHLDEIEKTVPGLSGRLDTTRIAMVGHSMGGHTVAMLAGMQVTDPETGGIAHLTDLHIASAVVSGAPRQRR